MLKLAHKSPNSVGTPEKGGSTAIFQWIPNWTLDHWLGRTRHGLWEYSFTYILYIPFMYKITLLNLIESKATITLFH